MGDDGIGAVVIDHLQEAALPSSVQIIKSRFPGLHLLQSLCSSDLMIIVDAVFSGAKPGTIFRFPFDETDLMNAPVHNCHSIGIPMLITAAHMEGHSPDVLVFGIETEQVEMTEGQLSEPVALAVERVRDLILKEIAGQCE